MEKLNPACSLDSFWRTLASAEHRILFLDYDGTLAPFVANRDEAWPYPGVVEIIDRIMASGKTRVIVVTGRSSESITSLLRLSRRPEIWASHGSEYLASDAWESKATSLIQADSKNLLLSAIASAESAGFGEYLEKKPFGVAVHWRGLPKAEEDEINSVVTDLWSAMSTGSQFEIHRFDGGLELRLQGANKGFAVDQSLRDYNGMAAAAYLGDDLTDEDAFAALGGRGLSVLVRPVLRQSRADIWIQPPQELLEFLQKWLSHCSD